MCDARTRAPERRSMDLRRGLRVVVGLALVSCPFATRAKDACPVSLEPGTASAAWQTARADAEKRLAKAHGDCSQVRIEVHEHGGATLRFTTTDGRVASRELASPSELPSVLDALLVTVPPEVPTASASSSEPAPSASASAVASPPVESTPKPPRTAISRSLRIEPTLGARIGLDEDVLAPSLMMKSFFVLGAFELGVRGEWNPLFGSWGRTPPGGFTMYSGFADVLAGVRLHAGPLELPIGVSAGVGGTYERAEGARVRTLQTRAGVYGGLALALDPAVRFTFGFGLDVVLSGLHDKNTQAKQIWPLPRTGLLLGLGLEVAP